MSCLSKSVLGALTLTQIVLSSTAVLGQEKTTPVLGQEKTDNGSSFAAGVTAGTLGIGAEASYLVLPYLVARSNVTWLRFNYNSFLSEMGLDSNNYDFTFSEFSVGGLLDFHPFQNGFRAVVGGRYTDFNFNQSRTDKPSYTINGNSYSNAQIGALNTIVSVKNRFAPYIGFGWDSAHYFSSVRKPDAEWSGEKFTVSFDLGALYTGGVDVNMTTDRTVASLPNDLASESQHVKKTFNNIYSFYPVAMTAFKYRF